MNEFDRGLILGAAHNVTVERILNEVRLTRKFTMTMSCAVFDENEQEVSGVSVKYTNNMTRLRSLSWYDTKMWSGSSSGFVNTDGTEFTGTLNYNNYNGSILAENPIVYVSADKTMLSKSDYALPDDVLQISWASAENAVTDDDGMFTTIHTYYHNETDADITVNKILIASTISSNTALLFEELLDTSITIKAGGQFARDYRFRLDC